MPDTPHTHAKNKRTGAGHTALRMAIYPALAIAMIVTLVQQPRVQELYFYCRWQRASNEDSRDTFFTALRLTSPSHKRMAGYWETRAVEIIPEHFGEGKAQGYWNDDEEDFIWGTLEPAIIDQYEISLIPALVISLKHQDKEARRSAAEGLGEISDQAMVAVPALIVALQDDESTVRREVAYALAYMGEKAEMAIPSLIIALEDREDSVRSAAASALGEIGKKSSVAVPALIRAMKLGGDSIAEALGKIGQSIESVVPALLAVLKTKDGNLYYGYAGRTLGKIAENNPLVIAVLITSLKDKGKYVRYAAADALGRIGENATPAIIPLIAALQDESFMVRQAAAGSLGEIGARAAPAVPALTITLKGNSSLMRRISAYALERIGAKSFSAIPALQHLADTDWDFRTRRSAKRAIVKINAAIVKASQQKKTSAQK